MTKVNAGANEKVNERVIEALKEIKSYTAADQIDAIDYAIEVMEKLKKEGITSPQEITKKS